jgi:hypothetical protein
MQYISICTTSSFLQFNENATMFFREKKIKMLAFLKLNKYFVGIRSRINILQKLRNTVIFLMAKGG